jgi:hypothetical protein
MARKYGVASKNRPPSKKPLSPTQALIHEQPVLPPSPKPPAWPPT